MEKLTKKRKFPLVGDLFALLLIFFLAQLVVLLVLPLFGVTLPVTSAIDTVPIEVYNAEQELLAKYCAIFYPLSMGLPILFMWLYLRLRGGKRVIRVRCSAAGFNPAVILGGVLWLLSSQIILEPIVALLPEHKTPGLGLGVWACITTIGFAPILEEILCRGLLFETFNKRWGVKLSILFSALFFGLIHFDLATLVVATVAGMIFGVLYVRTSSIFASIIVHAVNNALAFTLIVTGNDNVMLKDFIGNNTLYYIIYSLAVVIFVVASVEAFYMLKAKKKEAEAKTEEVAEQTAEENVEKVESEEANS